MSKFRKKPVVIEAFKWTGEHDQLEGPIWYIEAIKEGKVWFGVNDINDNDPIMFIDTLEGVHQARVGDYIIQDVKGELYPCKPDIFKITYEEVEDEILN